MIRLYKQINIWYSSDYIAIIHELDIEPVNVRWYCHVVGYLAVPQLVWRPWRQETPCGDAWCLRQVNLMVSEQCPLSRCPESMQLQLTRMTTFLSQVSIKKCHNLSGNSHFDPSIYLNVCCLKQFLFHLPRFTLFMIFTLKAQLVLLRLLLLL